MIGILHGVVSQLRHLVHDSQYYESMQDPFASIVILRYRTPQTAIRRESEKDPVQISMHTREAASAVVDPAFRQPWKFSTRTGSRVAKMFLAWEEWGRG